MAGTPLFHCGHSVSLPDGAVALDVLVSSLSTSPSGAGREPCGRSTQALGWLLLFQSASHFSRMENPRLESWSPGSAGSEQPAGREEPPKPPLAQGTVTRMPIGQNSFTDPTSRDSPESELLGGLQYRSCQNFLCSCPAAGAGRRDAAWPRAGRAVHLRRAGITRLCPQPSSCRRQWGWAELSFQALNYGAALATSAKVLLPMHLNAAQDAGVQ